MQNVMQIATIAGNTAQNDGHTAQNDSRTAQNDSHTAQNDGHTAQNDGATHIMFTKDQRGALRSPPGPQGTPLPLTFLSFLSALFSILCLFHIL